MKNIYSYTYKTVTKNYLISFLILGSSSFESQKMERPSISVISPTSPGALKDAPQVLPGQLSVCIFHTCWRPLVFAHCSQSVLKNKGHLPVKCPPKFEVCPSNIYHIFNTILYFTILPSFINY